MTTEAYPLSWPYGRKRTERWHRVRALFHRKRNDRYGKSDITIHEAVSFVLDQLRMIGVHDYEVIISTDLKVRLDGLPYSNQRQPDDPGASVWWRPAGAKTERVIAIDRYDRIADNIYAIGKTLEALRGIERWGGDDVQEQAFSGYAALEGPGTSVHDRAWALGVIGAKGAEPQDVLKNLYRIALSHSHPDKPTGDHESFIAVREAGGILGVSGA